MPVKRKAKEKSEVGVKVPHNVRQRYVNLFVEEFLKTSATVPEAFEKVNSELVHSLLIIFAHCSHNTSIGSLLLLSHMYLHIGLFCSHIHWDKQGEMY